MSSRKELFKKIFLVLVIILSVLPLIVTFSSVLTTIFQKMSWYVYLEDYLVPFESRLVVVLIKLVGITGQVASKENFSLVLLKEGIVIPVKLEWNCLGWQSMILLVITMVMGLRGRYSFGSKLQTLIIGILGTFIINLFRIAFIVILAYYWNSFAAIIIHDYFASFVALIWMLFFWWFCYSYVLELKKDKVEK